MSNIITLSVGLCLILSMLNYICLQYSVLSSNITDAFSNLLPINYYLLFTLHGFHLYQTCNLLKKEIHAFNLFIFSIVLKNIGRIYLALAFTLSEFQVRELIMLILYSEKGLT